MSLSLSSGGATLGLKGALPPPQIFFIKKINCIYEIPKSMKPISQYKFLAPNLAIKIIFLFKFSLKIKIK